MTKSNEIAAEGFRQRLIELMGKKPRSNQSKLARAAGVSPQAAGKWFQEGGFLPKDAMLKKVADYLDTTPAYLLYGIADVAPASENYVLQFVERGREATLLSRFRSATETGKDQLMIASEQIEMRPPEELPAHPESASH